MFVIEKVLHEYRSTYKPRTFWDNYWPVIILVISIIIVLALCLLRKFEDNIREAIKKAKVKRINNRYDRQTCTVDVIGVDNIRVYIGSTYSPPIPEKDGHSFGGWFVDSALTVPWLSTQKVEADMSLYPKWIKE